MGRDGWIGLGLLAFGGWFYSNLGKIPANPLVPIGPAYYPRILLILIMLLSLALVVQDVILRRRRESKGGGSRHAWVERYQPTFTCFIVFTLYVVFLPVIGFLVSSVLFVTSLQWFLGPLRLRRLPTAMLTGVTASLISYIVFEIYLRVLLPRGIFSP